MGDEVRKYLEDLAYQACKGREMRTTLDKIPAWVLRDAELEKFAELVAAQEREACAKLFDDEYFAFVAADKIRARGEA
tara:strand:+ start:159 stop:392 length:234 start_codon:yes stop_codon:yes gene_type:complete